MYKYMSIYSVAGLSALWTENIVHIVHAPERSNVRVAQALPIGNGTMTGTTSRFLATPPLADCPVLS